MKNQKSFLSILVLLLVSTSFIFTSCGASDDATNAEVPEALIEPIIQSAFDLRMNGKADSAEKVLLAFLQKDSTNAMAWFELTRTMDHLGLANPRKMMQEHGKVIEAASRAAELDPENAYYLSYKGSEQALGLYIDLMSGKTDVAEKLANVEKTYLDVLKVDPTFYEVKITLVELIGTLPADMGGDRLKAEQYAQELEEADAFSGAIAREILLDGEADRVEYWNAKTDLSNDAKLFEIKGKAYLMTGNIDKAKEYFSQAMVLDDEMNILYMDIARYYFYQVMQDVNKLDSLYPFIETNMMKYLNSDPLPCKPLQAWAYGTLAKLKMRLNEVEGKAYLEKANDLDPFFSRASGIPNRALFVAPDKVARGHGYFFRPF